MSYCGYDEGMPRKQRVTVTVDAELVAAGNRAVEAGEAGSLSGWVSTALAEKVDRDRRLALLRAAIADYEREFGEITPEEIAAQRRADRENAVVVRPRQPRRTAPARGRKAATA